jgi:phenylpropionate dioxygenase-like ring-hydroxylating dioxygenase large terminal subunit
MTVPSNAVDERHGAYALPACPASWHYVAPVPQLKRGPVQVELFRGGTYVGFCTESGEFAVLNNRCCHVGSNLAHGSVLGESIVCPLHGWEFNTRGECVRIPAGDAVPAWAQQCGYPVREIGGHVFFFNQPVARFPMPFFDGVTPDELVAADSFELHVGCAWYIASSNGFDLQHFRCAHDRVLLNEPVVDVPHPLARRIRMHLKVAGNSWRDAVTRRFSGDELVMTVTDWAGNLIFTTAKFARTTTYGMLIAEPVDEERTHARVIVFVRRSESAFARRFIDPLNAALRRNFIRAFLRADVSRTEGLHYHPRRLIESDRTLREYLEWLEQLHR